MSAADCKHPRRKHTVWYWVEDGDPLPVPRMATFDNPAALTRAQLLIGAVRDHNEATIAATRNP